MAEKRDIRIFCPVHEAVFEAPDAPKILCEITGHTLSSDFPNAEFWEFCCTCSTFSPSNLDRGEKARSVCFSCQNDISRRFICTYCKTAGFVSDKPSKGQTYFITEQGIGPSCPACGIGTEGKTIIRHDCREAEATFLTALDSCPFCLEKTAVGFVLPGKPLPPAQVSGGCPNCHAVNPPSALFCGKCRERLRFDVEIANPGTDISRTQLLGSLCPNCSTPVIPGFPFCGECGQAVKTPAAAPPPPPPPPPGPATVEYGSPDLSGTAGSGPGTNKIAVVAGGLVVLALLIVVGVSIGGRNGGSLANNSSSTPARPTPELSGTPNASKGDSRIGKAGRLSTDMNIRAYPGASDSNPKIGTHYRNAKVRILDVEAIEDSKGNRYNWFKIQVMEYGQSADPNFAGLSKDPGSPDVGWIHSYPNISQNSTEERKDSVNFDK